MLTTQWWTYITNMCFYLINYLILMPKWNHSETVSYLASANWQISDKREMFKEGAQQYYSLFCSSIHRMVKVKKKGQWTSILKSIERNNIFVLYPFVTSTLAARLMQQYKQCSSAAFFFTVIEQTQCSSGALLANTRSYKTIKQIAIACTLCSV